MTTQGRTGLPWHNHKFVKDPRYGACAICAHAKDAPHHTKKAKRSLASVLRRKPWRVYVARQDKK